MQGKVIGLAALAAVSILLLYGPTLEAVHLAAFAAILVVVAGVDQATRRIPNALVLAAFSVRILYIAIMWFSNAGEASSLLVESLFGAVVIGGGLLVFTMIADSLRGGENMGGGDIKLLAVIGFYFGLPVGLFVMAAACALGACATLLLQRSSRGAPDSQPGTFPLGPAIAVSAIAAMLVLCPPIQSLLLF